MKAWEESNHAMRAAESAALAKAQSDSQIALANAVDSAVKKERDAVKAAAEKVRKEQIDSHEAFSDLLRASWRRTRISTFGRDPNSGWIFLNPDDSGFLAFNFALVGSVTLENSGASEPLLRFKARQGVNWFGFTVSDGAFLTVKSLDIQAGYSNNQELLAAAERAIKAYAPP